MQRSTGPMPAFVPASSPVIVQRTIDLIPKPHAERITVAGPSRALPGKPEALGRLTLNGLHSVLVILAPCG